MNKNYNYSDEFMLIINTFSPEKIQREKTIHRLAQISAAEKIAKQITLPLEAAIDEFAVYQCSPFLELKKFGLSR